MQSLSSWATMQWRGLTMRLPRVAPWRSLEMCISRPGREMDGDSSHGTAGLATEAVVSGIDREPAVIVSNPGVQEGAGAQIDDREAEDVNTQEAAHGAGDALTGKKVSKKFGRKFYTGTVLSYDAETHWYKVHYEDGDQEELSWLELEPLLIDSDSSPSKKRPRSSSKRASKRIKEIPAESDGSLDVKSDEPSGEDDDISTRRLSARRGSKRKSGAGRKRAADAEAVQQEEEEQSKHCDESPVASAKPKKTPSTPKQDLGSDLVGSKTKKKFGRKVYIGEVVGYDPEARYYKVRYEDDDEEELEWKELERTLTFTNQMSGQGHDQTQSLELKPEEQSELKPEEKTVSELKPEEKPASASPVSAALSPVSHAEVKVVKSDFPLCSPECTHPALETTKSWSMDESENLEFHAWGEVVSYDKVKCPELQAMKMFPTLPDFLQMAASHHHLAVITTAGQVWVWRIRHGNIRQRCNSWEHIPDLNDQDIILVDIAGPDLDRSAAGYAPEQEDQVPDPFYLVAVSRQGVDYIFQGSQPHEPVCTSRFQLKGLKALMQSIGLSTEGVGRIVQATAGVVESFDEPPFIGYITDNNQVFLRSATDDHIEGVNCLTGFSGKPLKVQCGRVYTAIVMTDDGHAWTLGHSSDLPNATSAVCQPALGSLVGRRVVDVGCYGHDFVALTDDGGIHCWTQDTASSPALIATCSENLRSIALGSGVCAGISAHGKVHTWRTPKQDVGCQMTPLGRDEYADTAVLGAKNAVKVFCTRSSLIVVSHKRLRKRKGTINAEQEQEGSALEGC